MNEEIFNFIAKLLMLFLGLYFVIFYKSLGERAIKDRMKIMSFFHLSMGDPKVNIKIAQFLNLIVGGLMFIVSILLLING